ncbi:hypothetical protein [Companilactobacillus hulinensis]|uniref:hypothetical protein n=1 Tax=Companilactobacillus hulinensis TaxID=2486007 RepID=UPI000F77F954|nr:hypothetical protein [Companilactobacillus hulinensis]
MLKKFSKEWATLDVYCGTLAGLTILLMFLEWERIKALSMELVIMWILSVILILIPQFIKLYHLKEFPDEKKK